MSYVHSMVNRGRLYRSLCKAKHLTTCFPDGEKDGGDAAAESVRFSGVFMDFRGSGIIS